MMSLQEFKDYCRKVWNEANHNSVTVDLRSGKLNGKYRKHLHCLYLPRIKDVSINDNLDWYQLSTCKHQYRRQQQQESISSYESSLSLYDTFLSVN